MKTSKFSVDASTGDLYENDNLVGKLITRTSGAWLRLITQANRVHIGVDESNERIAQENKAALLRVASEASQNPATRAVIRCYAKSIGVDLASTPIPGCFEPKPAFGQPDPKTGVYDLSNVCEICGGSHDPAQHHP